ALRVEARRPGLLSVWNAAEELTGRAVEDVIKTIPIRDRQQLASFGLEQNGHVRGIPIVQIVRGELKVPAEAAGGGVERDDGTGIQIVALTGVAVVIGSWIAGAPVNEVQLRIVGTGDPRGRAAGLPTLLVPGFVSWLARARDSPEAPQAAA